MKERIIIGDASRNAVNTVYGAVCATPHISESSTFYWVTGNVSDRDFFIEKTTKEGKRLTKLLKDGKTKDLLAFVNKLEFEALSYDEFLEIIESKEKRAFDEGRKSAQQEIRIALGIY